MQKHNFFDVKEECIKVVDDEIIKLKDLPKDINQPVHDMLINELKKPLVSEKLKMMEDCVRCGEIQIFIKNAPKYIIIRTNYGMVAVYDLCEDYNFETYSFTIKTQKKNKNLSMKKPKWLIDRIKREKRK